MHDQLQYDVLIIGSGASGLSLALKLADFAHVAVMSKNSLTESATLYAQGGVSAVLDEYDSIALHVQDTLLAGAGLCDEQVVRHVVEQSQQSINWLVEQGVDFTRLDNQSDPNSPFHLHQEGGHSHRRIIHAADATGREIQTTLEEHVKTHPSIDIFEHHIAIDLIIDNKHIPDKHRCIGAYILDLDKKSVEVFKAKHTVLATGGAGKAYLYTSNPDACTGDGIAMAYRAGCRIANMEFIQFHPTCLYHPEARSFLISEALRGEGAKLLSTNGEPFMQRYDAREELAPRDIVARAIDSEMKRSGEDCVYLDMTHRSQSFIQDHFPTISARCLEYGIDISQQAIPVVPAAHYTCGGIMIDTNGQTDIPGLVAIGEASCSGLHGANRMASNSLLECIVYAHAAYRAIRQSLAAISLPRNIPAWDESRVTDSDEEVVVSHNWDEIRRFMWDYVGIVRTTKRLQRAQHRIRLLQSEISEYYGNFRVSKDLIELRNLAVIAELIINSALRRRESRGLHFTADYPVTTLSRQAKNTILSRKPHDNDDAAA